MNCPSSPKRGTLEQIFFVTVLAGVCPFGLVDVVRGQRLFWGILQNLQKRFAFKRHRGATTLINSCLSVVDFVQSVESKTWHSKSQKTKMDHFFLTSMVHERIHQFRTAQPPFSGQSSDAGGLQPPNLPRAGRVGMLEADATWAMKKCWKDSLDGP